MGRDLFTCQKCGNKSETLNVHHRHYLTGRDPWDYPGELLITVCQPCHHQEENAKTNADELFKTLHFWGYFNTEIIAVMNKMIEERMDHKVEAKMG